MKKKKPGIVEIHGREYQTVPLRVHKFRTDIQYKGWCISTEILVQNEKGVAMKASIMDAKDRVVATGHAEETRQGQINRTSALENCETSAVGRALAFLGLGGEEYSVASAEEVSNAIRQQDQQKRDPAPSYAQVQATKHRKEYTEHKDVPNQSWSVHSSDGLNVYNVWLHGQAWGCECEGFARKRMCRHMPEIRLKIGAGMIPAPQDVIEMCHRTRNRDWTSLKDAHKNRIAGEVELYNALQNCPVPTVESPPPDGPGDLENVISQCECGVTVRKSPEGDMFLPSGSLHLCKKTAKNEEKNES